MKRKLQTVKKLNGLLKLHLPSNSSNRLIAPQIPTLFHKNFQLWTTAIALQSPDQNTLLPIASQLTHHNEAINPHLKMPIASQITLQNSKPQFAVNNQPLLKSHSFKKIAAYALRNSDIKECEQSEELDQIKPMFNTKSSNHHKFFKPAGKLVRISNQ